MRRNGIEAARNFRFGSKFTVTAARWARQLYPWQLTNYAAPRTIEECRLSLAGRRDNPNRS